MFVKRIIEESPYFGQITTVISGTANGVDQLGELWAKGQKPPIPIEQFPAQWADLAAEGAKIKINKYGNKYNVLAGFQRNQKMAEAADAAIIIIRQGSNGSEDMLERMNKLKKPVHVVRL